MMIEDNMLFGIHPVLEALKAGKEIEKVFLIKNSRNDQHAIIRKLCLGKGVPVSDVPVEKLNRMTRKTHQGVIAFASLIQYAEIDTIIDACFSKGENPFILILDQITDVRNFGAIARSAEAMGVHALLVPAKGGALINADAEKASAGALNHIPVCRVRFLDKAITSLKESGLKIIACTEKTDKLITQIDFKGPKAIILGSEEDGISESYLKMCDDKGRIPMTGKVDSLNVSVSCGIVLYEAVRPSN